MLQMDLGIWLCHPPELALPSQVHLSYSRHRSECPPPRLRCHPPILRYISPALLPLKPPTKPLGFTPWCHSTSCSACSLAGRRRSTPHDYPSTWTPAQRFSLST